MQILWSFLCLLFFVLLNDQMQRVDHPLVFKTRFHRVDASGFDAGMAENICQFCQILLLPVEGHGKQMPKVMGKNLFGADTGQCT